MTHKQRMMKTIRGNMPDVIPFAPRIDLWFDANQKRGTLPSKYVDVGHPDNISRDQGWAIHKIVPEYQAYGIDSILDRPLGIYRHPAQGFLTHLPGDVERQVSHEGDLTKLRYITCKGEIEAAFTYTEAMQRSGVSIPWINHHALKGEKDFAPLGYIFENLKIEPWPEGFINWAAPLGNDGICAAYASTAASPMHHIMKILCDATQFYYVHRDYEKQIKDLVESIGVYFRNVLKTVTDGPAELVTMGANVDDTITYPPLFRDHILPWLQEAADSLHAKGKLMVVHTDGENKGLLDFLYESGMDLADSVCPAPMTKVSIGEYYHRWSDRITIQGGIPSNLTLPDATTDEVFENYLAKLLEQVVPGNRLILGVADAVPPDASFDRLIRIAELVEQKGRLPLKGRKWSPTTVQAASSFDGSPMVLTDDSAFAEIREDMITGDDQSIVRHIRESLDQGVPADDILNEGMLFAMEQIGKQFKAGKLFVPEVLLAARVMNQGLSILEPHLATDRKRGIGKILIGTVLGDLHDIGKNMVTIMLRGVGFDVKDLGINISAETFIREVKEYKPDIVGLSALLTTTMPEMQNVIEKLTQAGLRDTVKIMVGGAPVSETYALGIEADGYAKDAGEAVDVAKQLMGI
ncbi:cobalamin-dependent protein [Thermodesulfobacteriota bacterium]